MEGCHRENIILPEIVKLESEKELLKEIINPEFLTKVGDKLIISSSQSDEMLHIYSLPDLKHLSSTVKKGLGPEEINPFPMFCESPEDYLYVWGYGPKKINKYSISNDGDLSLNYSFKLAKYESFNNMHIINDSIFLYYLPDYLTIAKSDLTTGGSLDRIKFEKENHRESYFYSNRGSIAANKSYLVYGFLFKKQINIYRMNDLNIESEIVGDYNPSEPVLGDFNTPTYYTNLIAEENFFYAMCNDPKSGCVIMEIYSYEGQCVNRFSFDINPQGVVVDEKNRMIYGYSVYNESEIYLLKFRY